MIKNFFLFLLIFLFFPIWAEGAVLYLEPSKGEYQSGDIFLVEIKIDTRKECINAVEVELEFSPEVLKAIDFSQGLSILTLWIESPEIKQELGLISFSGGIPGGYCGQISGDPGLSHIVGKIAFQAKKEGEAKLEFLESSQILLNDGFGTPAELTAKGAVFTILSEKAEPKKNEWIEELQKDNISPEIFEIEIHQDPNIFEGKYFIIFSTTDKQTGIDYYEILEEGGDWQKAESPHLLKDQTLKSIIKVKAVDKARNERIAEYVPPKKPFLWQVIIVALVGMGLIYWITKRFRNK